MPLLTKRKVFFVTADTTNVLSGDEILGSTGKGTYKIWATSTKVDSTITISDGNSNVLNAAPIPVKAAAVTYPAFDKTEDFCWVVQYIGNADTIPINIVDGTDGEITLVVEKIS